MIKINVPMFLFTICGGVLAWFLGELFITETVGTNIPTFIKTGIYFAIFSLVVSLFALLAETFFPILNGRNWRREYCGSSYKHVAWVALSIGLVTGTLFQFLYDLDLTTKTRNVIMLIDNSGSMLDNDPSNKRLDAASHLIETMKDTNAAVISFTDNSKLIQPFTRLSDNSIRSDITGKIQNMNANGGTNIESALNLAIDHIYENEVSQNCVVILLSDGYSDVNLVKTLTPYIQQNIRIYSVGLYDRDNISPLLAEISNYTNGAFYDVEDAATLPTVFSQIYEKTTIDQSFFSTEGNKGLNIFLKVLFLIIIGAAVGGGVALIFDNKYLLIAFIFGGAMGGLLSAMALQYFVQSKLLALIILASCFSLFSVFVKLPDYGAVDDGWKR